MCEIRSINFIFLACEQCCIESEVMQLQIRHGRMFIHDELENGYDLFQLVYLEGRTEERN
jgi:hypothetical protein